MIEKEYTGLEIAVIGMAGKFPGAGSIEEFWENLKNGKECITHFSDEELLNENIKTEFINNPSYIKAKGLLKSAAHFDAEFFGYSANEADMMDPQMRILHECAYEALEDAGYVADEYKDLIGFYAGAMPNYYWENCSVRGTEEFSEQFDAMHLLDKDFLTSRISYKLDLRGPSVSIITACSTGLSSIHVACRALLTGECKMALAGSVAVYLPLVSGYMHKEGTLASPDGKCKSFDAEANGTVPGDGAGVVILKLMEDAIEDGDNIYAIIKGSAVNNDGSRKVGYTATSIDGASEVISLAHSFSRVEAESVSYIETHGVGTLLGDAMEIEALKQAFNEEVKTSITIGSVKPNIGYLGPAAGIAGFIKVVLALYHKQIPPSINFKKPNNMVDFENFCVNQKLTKWESNKFPLRAGINSFAVGGTNVHIVLEEAPDFNQGSVGTNKFNLLPLSAKTEVALDKMTVNLKEYINKCKDTDLNDLAYTLKVGRKNYPCRRFFITSGIDDAIDCISTMDPEKTKTVVLEGNKNKNVFLFPDRSCFGHSSVRYAYKTQDAFRCEIDNCLHIVKKVTGFDCSGYFGDESQTSKMVTDFLLAFTIQYSLAKMLIKLGVVPDAVFGYEMGEIVAACTAGVLSVEDSINLVSAIGRALDSSDKNNFICIYSPEDKVLGHLKGSLKLVAVNNKEKCVITGEQKELSELIKNIENDGLDYRVLAGGGYYNGSTFGDGFKIIEDVINKIQFKKPEIPFISSQTGTWANQFELVKPDYWIKHFQKPVMCHQGLAKLLDNDNRIFIEVGDGRNFIKELKQHENKKDIHSDIALLAPQRSGYDGEFYLLRAIGSLWAMGAEINWKEYYGEEKRKKVSLPKYAFEKRKYKI